MVTRRRTSAVPMRIMIFFVASAATQARRSSLYFQRPPPRLLPITFCVGASRSMRNDQLAATFAYGRPPHSRHEMTPSPDAGDIHPPEVQRVAQCRPHRPGPIDGHLVHRAPEHLGARLAER